MKRLLGVKKTINNNGFSLVELLIAIAIASIVGASVFGFMTVGAKTFGSESTDVHLQNEAQLAFNQIQDLMIDTVVGIDYVYVADDFSDDSHKITTDAELPATIKGKKLIMYNTSGSGRNIYEIVWKADDQKLYYNEYTVAVDDVSGTVSKGSHIGETDALMAEYVTGFSADLSLVESKRVARIEISYEKDGRPYISSHNITLRNKIVSGNKVPQFMISENIVHLSASINGPEEIFVEPGDVCMLNSSYSIIDDTGAITSATKNWYLDSSTVDINTQLSTDGQLKVSNAQKDDFTITVKSGDGLATKDVDVRIIRITTIDGISWEHTGSIGKGEIAGGTTPTADDLIAGEKFKLTVTGMSGTNLDETSFNGHTVERKVVFIKTKGSDLFKITSQDGTSCECEMSSSLNSNTNTSNTSSNPDEIIQWTENNGAGTISYKTTDIQVTAVSLYSMGGRGYTGLADPDISSSDFDYTAASSLPTSVGAASYVSANRYYESGAVKPVAEHWNGQAYATLGNFNIGANDWQRGQHYPVSVLDKNGNAASTTTNIIQLSDGKTINWNDFYGVIDIKLTEYNHKADGTIKETVTNHYCPNNLTKGEGTHWGINCPADYSANSDFVYEVVAYLFPVASNDWRHHNTYVFGQLQGLKEEDLKDAKYISNTCTVRFDRLILAFERKSENDSNVVVSGSKNEHAALYVKEYGKEYRYKDDSNNEIMYNFGLQFTYSPQFKNNDNPFNGTDKWYYFKPNADGSWDFTNKNNLGTISNVNPKGSVANGQINFSNLKLNDFYNDTACKYGHLRLVPKYKTNGSDGRPNRDEWLFDNYVDVYIWNIKIPKINNILDAQVSYFPVPADISVANEKDRRKEYEKKYKGDNIGWTGALITNGDKKTTSIFYTLTPIGEADADKPSYKLTLKYINPDKPTEYKELASYECSFDGREWKKK
ncbi:MAG: prepilin-type N-terminal cleavage/methylation domain-containing protein [Lachnospiraceae bacterium]|nr:prepilin-type N-terminal cleavage/methylation domain-containing protein [Lachnospiraceae bacterium]